MKIKIKIKIRVVVSRKHLREYSPELLYLLDRFRKTNKDIKEATTTTTATTMPDHHHPSMEYMRSDLASYMVHWILKRVEQDASRSANANDNSATTTTTTTTATTGNSDDASSSGAAAAAGGASYTSVCTNCILALLPGIALTKFDHDSDEGEVEVDEYSVRTMMRAVTHLANVGKWKECLSALSTIQHGAALMQSSTSTSSSSSIYKPQLDQLHAQLFNMLATNNNNNNNNSSSSNVAASLDKHKTDAACTAAKLFAQIRETSPTTAGNFTMLPSAWKHYLSTPQLSYTTIIDHVYNDIFSNPEAYESASAAAQMKMGGVLTVIMKQLCAKHQPAWAFRVMNDWIRNSNSNFNSNGEKSGEISIHIYPPIGAVAALLNALSSTNTPHATEVINLCHSITTSTCTNHYPSTAHSSSSSMSSYFNAVYTTGVTALYNAGAYEDADELYLIGVSTNALPWPYRDEEETGRIELDLHGMSTALAHSFVRCALRSSVSLGSDGRPAIILDQEEGNAKDGDVEVVKRPRDIVIITGRGVNSKQKFRPILRPEVQRMLSEEFFPPIGSSTLKKNMGALMVSKEDVAAWLSHQKQQTARRMLLLADILKSPIEKLRSFDKLMKR